MSAALGLIVGALFGAIGAAAGMSSLLEARERELRDARDVVNEQAQERLARGDLCPYCRREP